jgi:hypothetical protein
MSKDMIIQVDNEKIDQKEIIAIEQHSKMRFQSLEDFCDLNSKIFMPFSHFKKSESELPIQTEMLTEAHIEILKKELNINENTNTLNSVSD